MAIVSPPLITRTRGPRPPDPARAADRRVRPLEPIKTAPRIQKIPRFLSVDRLPSRGTGGNEDHLSSVFHRTFALWLIGATIVGVGFHLMELRKIDMQGVAFCVGAGCLVFGGGCTDLMAALPFYAFDLDATLDSHPLARRTALAVFTVMYASGLNTYPHVACLSALMFLVKMIWDELTVGCCGGSGSSSQARGGATPRLRFTDMFAVTFFIQCIQNGSVMVFVWGACRATSLEAARNDPSLTAQGLSSLAAAVAGVTMTHCAPHDPKNTYVVFVVELRSVQGGGHAGTCGVCSQYINELPPWLVAVV